MNVDGDEKVEVVLRDRMQYRGFVSSIGWDEDNSCWKGEILHKQYPIIFEGDWFEDLEVHFKYIVDEILKGY